ncbi:hypothetical protein ACQ86N_06715 [Puia sp. P3]|uniref:hypothetical protein n=1 Tax=Puia sp. P3 TaxID=3423952 RepID=UPI003D67C4CE
MNYKYCLLAGLTVVSVLAVALLRPIAQPPVFHHFAGGGKFFGVVNGANVLSNLLFLIAGGVGLVGLRKGAIAVLSCCMGFFLWVWRLRVWVRPGII